MSVLPAKSWIQYWQPRPQAKLRLFCFPYAGAGASIFRDWPEGLPAHIEVCPVQLPGRENRLSETPFVELSALIESMGPALVPYMDKPFALWGHSMGALICFELARYLRRAYPDLSPVRLLVSGRRAPQLPASNPPVHHLPDTEFIDVLRGLHGTPEDVLKNDELTRMVLPILRTDFALCETYTYQPEKPLNYSISAFGGLHDDDAPRSLIDGWRQQTTRSFKLRFFVGGHFFIQNERKSVLQAIAQDLFNT